MTYTAAQRVFDALRLEKGYDCPTPWGEDAQDLLRAAELAELAARSAASRAVSAGAGREERARTRALERRATALVESLHKRRRLGVITSEELRRARSALAGVQSGKITPAAVARAEQRRVAEAQRRTAAVEAELEAAGSVPAMAVAMAAALEAELQRADSHVRRLSRGKDGRNGPHVGTAELLAHRAYRALVAWHEARDAGAEITTGEWRAAVEELARLRADMDELEARLRRGVS